MSRYRQIGEESDEEEEGTFTGNVGGGAGRGGGAPPPPPHAHGQLLTPVQNQPPPPQTQPPNPDSVRQLQEMGFRKEIVEHALVIHNQSVDTAMDWLLQHADKPNAMQIGPMPSANPPPPPPPPAQQQQAPGGQMHQQQQQAAPAPPPPQQQQMQYIRCGGCGTTLAYPIGASTVSCPVCNARNHINQAPPPPQNHPMQNAQNAQPPPPPRRPFDVQECVSSINLFAEMVQAAEKEDRCTNEMLDEMVEQCRAYVDQIQSEIGNVSDEGLMMSLLGANDTLNDAMSRFGGLQKPGAEQPRGGNAAAPMETTRPAPEPAPAPAPAPAAPLIDMSEPAPASSAAGLEDDFLTLDIHDDAAPPAAPPPMDDDPFAALASREAETDASAWPAPPPAPPSQLAAAPFAQASLQPSPFAPGPPQGSGQLRPLQGAPQVDTPLFPVPPPAPAANDFGEQGDV